MDRRVVTSIITLAVLMGSLTSSCSLLTYKSDSKALKECKELRESHLNYLEPFFFSYDIKEYGLFEVSEATIIGARNFAEDQSFYDLGAQCDREFPEEFNGLFSQAQTFYQTCGTRGAWVVELASWYPQKPYPLGNCQSLFIKLFLDLDGYEYQP